MMRVSLPLPVKDAVRHIEAIFLDEGFELFTSPSVSDMVARRMGVETAAARLLLFLHPVVAFQALVAGGDAIALAGALVVVKGAPGGSSIVRVRVGPRGGEDCCTAMEGFVARQGRRILLRSVDRLRTDSFSGGAAERKASNADEYGWDAGDKRRASPI